MIDSILARYHWTIQYLMWDVSWVNVQMMLRDSIQCDFQSGENKSDDVIDLSKPHGKDDLKRLLG